VVEKLGKAGHEELLATRQGAGEELIFLERLSWLFEVEYYIIFA